MRFKVTWTEERTGAVEASDIKTAEQCVRERITRSPQPALIKLLSIYLDQPTTAPTPPTPTTVTPPNIASAA